MNIIEIAHLRNLISSRHYGKREEELLLNIEKNIVKSQSPLAAIAMDAIVNCKADVTKADYESAARELHLIHNFPLQDSNLARWDSNYFFKFELLGYIEMVKDVERIKKLISNLAKV